MNERENSPSAEGLTGAQQRLHDVWEEHIRYEFVTRSIEDTLATMVDDAYVNHVPVLTGGVGREELREFWVSRSRNARFCFCNVCTLASKADRRDSSARI